MVISDFSCCLYNNGDRVVHGDNTDKYNGETGECDGVGCDLVQPYVQYGVHQCNKWNRDGDEYKYQKLVACIEKLIETIYAFFCIGLNHWWTESQDNTIAEGSKSVVYLHGYTEGGCNDWPKENVEQ